MHNYLLLLNALMAGTTPPSVTITEIMYDPSSPERAGESEWIELMNTGSTPVDLAGWTIDDEDASDWGVLSGTLDPGDIAVIINGDAGTARDFHQAWSLDPTTEPQFMIIPVAWGSLDNQPSSTNEILRLIDADGTVACTVNYQRGGEWPDPRRTGQSIHLTSLEPGTGSSGANWALTTPTSKGARAAQAAGVFTRPDIGSPGIVPAAPPPQPAPVPRDQPSAPGNPGTQAEPDQPHDDIGN